MINPKQFPLCEQIVERLLRKFSDGGWITLCDERIFSCLANDDVSTKSMMCSRWDINHSEAGPRIDEIDEAFAGYSRCSNAKVEPIVMCLESEGRWAREVFLAEEFVMYFKLHKERKGENEYAYYQVDQCGDDVEVATVRGVHLDVKLKYIKEYIAVKKLNLLVFIDELIYSNKSIDELGGNCIQMNTVKGNDCVFSYSLNESGGCGVEDKSCATFRGKCILRYNDKDIQHLWKLCDSRYEEFIVAADEDGNDVPMSCDEKRMPNLFTRQGNEPYSLSPVFFKRDVLSKYSQRIEKYSIQDGYLSGPSWGIRIDNDRSDEYVVVALVDLGRMPYKEQLHWRSFNVLPPRNGSYSRTTFRRWFAAIPTNCSEAPDLVFKQLYIQVNDKWRAKYGWPLFKELATDDRYHFETLHLMGQDYDQKEFDGLIQSITKLLIDSLNEKELVNSIDSTNPDVKKFLTENEVEGHSPSNIKTGITKFECFLVSEQAQNNDLVNLLRKVQTLRSSTVAHRKSTKLGTKTQSLFDFFGILRDSDKVVFFNLLERLNGALEWIISIAE